MNVLFHSRHKKKSCFLLFTKVHFRTCTFLLSKRVELLVLPKYFFFTQVSVLPLKYRIWILLPPLLNVVCGCAAQHSHFLAASNQLRAEGDWVQKQVREMDKEVFRGEGLSGWCSLHSLWKCAIKRNKNIFFFPNTLIAAQENRSLVPFLCESQRRRRLAYQTHASVNTKNVSRGIKICFFIIVGVGFYCDIVPVNSSLGPFLKRRTAWPCILSLALLKNVGTACCTITDQTFPRAVNTRIKGTRQVTRIETFILNSFFFPLVTAQKHAFQLKIQKNDGLILFSTLVFLVWKCSTLTQCHSAAAVAPTKWSHINRSSCASLFRRQVKMPAGGTGPCF